MTPIALGKSSLERPWALRQTAQIIGDSPIVADIVVLAEVAARKDTVAGESFSEGLCAVVIDRAAAQLQVGQGGVAFERGS